MSGKRNIFWDNVKKNLSESEINLSQKIIENYIKIENIGKLNESEDEEDEFNSSLENESEESDEDQEKELKSDEKLNKFKDNLNNSELQIVEESNKDNNICESDKIDLKESIYDCEDSNTLNKDINYLKNDNNEFGEVNKNKSNLYRLNTNNNTSMSNLKINETGKQNEKFVKFSFNNLPQENSGSHKNINISNLNDSIMNVEAEKKQIYTTNDIIDLNTSKISLALSPIKFGKKRMTKKSVYIGDNDYSFVKLESSFINNDNESLYYNKKGSKNLNFSRNNLASRKSKKSLFNKQPTILEQNEDISKINEILLSNNSIKILEQNDLLDTVMTLRDYYVKSYFIIEDRDRTIDDLKQKYLDKSIESNNLKLKNYDIEHELNVLTQKNNEFLNMENFLIELESQIDNLNNIIADKEKENLDLKKKINHQEKEYLQTKTYYEDHVNDNKELKQINETLKKKVEDQSIVIQKLNKSKLNSEELNLIKREYKLKLDKALNEKELLEKRYMTVLSNFQVVDEQLKNYKRKNLAYESELHDMREKVENYNENMKNVKTITETSFYSRNLNLITRKKHYSSSSSSSSHKQRSNIEKSNKNKQYDENDSVVFRNYKKSSSNSQNSKKSEKSIKLIKNKSIHSINSINTIKSGQNSFKSNNSKNKSNKSAKKSIESIYKKMLMKKILKRNLLLGIQAIIKHQLKLKKGTL